MIGMFRFFPAIQPTRPANEIMMLILKKWDYESPVVVSTPTIYGPRTTMSNVLVSDGRVLVRVTVDDNEVVSLSILVLCVLLFFFVHFSFLILISSVHSFSKLFFKLFLKLFFKVNKLRRLLHPFTGVVDEIIIAAFARRNLEEIL